MIPGRIVALALAVALLFGAGVTVAATRDSDNQSATGAPPAIDRAETTTSSTALPTTTVTPETSTTQSPERTTTTRQATTTVVRPTTTTRPRASTTTTTATLRDCAAAQIEVRATTGKRTYAPTEQVTFESTLRNRSTTACTYVGYTFQATFADPAGRRIIEVITVADERAPKPLVPGAVLTGAVPFDQGACQQQPCPTLTPGPGYSATASWGFPGGPYLASATFTLG